MKPSYNGLRNIALTAALLMSQSTKAQYLMPSNVLSNGGQQGSGGGYTLAGTVGQGGIGVMGNGSNTMSGGFWFTESASAVATVTFQLDARPAMQWGRFHAQRDSIVLRGGFAPLQWVGVNHILTDVDNDSIYSITVGFDSTGTLEFKFVIRHDGFDLWEFDAAGNRLGNINAGTYSLAPLSYNDLPPYAANTGEYLRDTSTVGVWHFNDDSSSTYYNYANGGQVMFDQSGNGNHGYNRGSSLIDGRFGKTRGFNGASDYVEGSTNSLNFGSQSFTLEAWINTSSSAGQAIFTSHSASSKSNLGLYIAGSGLGFFDLDINNGQGSKTNFNGRKINDGLWHHVAAVRTGNLGFLYVDGKLDFVDTLTQNPNNSTSFRIGATDPGSYFNGLIDEVRISNITRSPQEFNLQLPPRNLLANATGTTIDLSWQNGGGAVALQKYYIYRGADSISTNMVRIDSTSNNNYANAGLAPNATYYYRVSAVDVTGFEGARSNAASAMLAAEGIIAEVEPNNDSTKAQVLTLGDTVAASIGITGDIDYYKFFATAGDTIEITADTSSGSGLLGYFAVYDPNGSYAWDGYYPSYQNIHLIFPVTITGTHFIRFAHAYTFFNNSFPNSALKNNAPAVSSGDPKSPHQSTSRLRIDPMQMAIAGTAAAIDTGAYRLSVKRFTPSAPQLWDAYVPSTFSNSATLGASVLPNGLNTTMRFDYGTTPVFGNSTPAQSGNGIYPIFIAAPIGGLQPNTSYYFRAVLTNSAGTFISSEYVFTTAPPGEGWTVQNSGTTEYLEGVSLATVNTGIAVGGYNGVFRTTNGGAAWTSQSDALGTGIGYMYPYSAWSIDENNVVIVGSGAQTIARTQNGGTTWLPPTSVNSSWDLYKVFFVNPATGYAVGAAGTIVKTSDGGATWLTQNNLNPQNLYGIHFGDAGNGGAVGANGTILHTIDGGANWSEQPSNTFYPLYGIWFFDANNGIAVGGGGTILRTFNGGAQWDPVSTPFYQYLFGIHFYDQNNGVVVGEGGLVLRTTDRGFTWIQQASGTYNALYDVSVAGRSTMAVGEYGTILNYLAAVGETETNNTIATANLIGVGEAVFGSITPAGDVDFFKFGAQGGDTLEVFGSATENSTLRGLVQIYNSANQFISSVGQFPTPTSQHLVFTVADTGTFFIRYSNIFVGDTGAYQIRLRRFSPSPAEVRTNGAINIYSNTADFSATTAPNGLSTNVEFEYGENISYGSLVAYPSNPVSGIFQQGTTAPVSGLTANTTYNFKARAQNSLGGSAGSNITFTTPPPPDGWVRQFSGTGLALLGVEFLTPSIGTAVGNGGVILKTVDGGASWVTQNSGMTLNLRGVSFTDENNGTAVGLGGLILRTTDAGVTWNSKPSQTTSSLRAVKFWDTNLGVVVGLSGTIRKTTDGGETWEIQTSPNTSGLHGIFIVNTSTYVAVGDGGTILRTVDGGVNWVPQTSNTPTQSLLGVYFFDASTGIVTGTGGTILKTIDGGVNWLPIQSNSSAILYTPEFPALDNGIIVGSGGTILRSTDQGQSWTSQSSGTLNQLISVSFAHPDTGTAVGEFGAVLRFNKAASVPVAPLLASPADGDTSQPRTLTLQWNPSQTAASYHLQLARDVGFTSFVVDDSTLVDISRVVSNLSYSTQYYWRVRAKNVAGYSNFSLVSSFRTGALAAPSAPALASPTSGQSNQSLSLTLRWNSSATAAAYRAQLGTDQTFAGGIIKDSTLADTSMAVSGLTASTTYYWRVSATNTGGTSAYSPVFSFSTQAANAPTAATNAATGVGLSSAILNATVNPNGQTTSAYFEYGQTLSYGFTTVARSIGNGTVDVQVRDTIRALAANTLYHFRVVATSSQGQVFGSDVTFTTVTLPIAPANLQVTTFNASSATIAWADNSTNEESFRVERKLGTGSWAEIKSLPAQTVSYQDTGLTSNSTYYYKVRSANSAGFSAYTDSIMVETVLAPFAQSSVRKVTFPDLEIPSSTYDSTIVLTNAGSAPLLIGSTAITGTNASDFTIISGGGLGSLNPGASRNIVVRFQPSTTGAKQAILQVTTDDNTHYSNGLVTDTLTGNGVDTTPPGAPLLIGPSLGQDDWYNGSSYTINWSGLSDASGIAKLWYKYDTAPADLSPGSSVNVSGSNAQIVPPAAGVHVSYFYFEDGAGNKDVNSATTLTLKYDNVAPTITHDTATVAAVVILNGAVQGSGAVINASASKAANLSAVVPSTFKLEWRKVSTSTWNPVTFPSLSGNATIPASAFIEGNPSQPVSLEYRLTAADEAGNMATEGPYPVKVSIQTGAPTGLSSPAATNWTNSNTITVTWTGPVNSFGVSKLWYKYNSAPAVGQEGLSVAATGTSANWSAQIPSPSTPGQPPAYFYLEDSLGNRSIANYTALTIMFDNVRPTISHNSAAVGTVIIAADGSVTNNASIVASATKPGGNAPVDATSFRLEYKRSADPGWSALTFGSLINASLTIPNATFASNGRTYAVDYLLTAKDQAGNDSTTKAFSITVVIQRNTVSDYVPPPVATLPTGTAIERAYRIFSVPMDLNDKKPSSFMETSLGPHASDGVDYYNWRVQRFINNTLQDYETFKNDPAVTPGAGFWLILREPGKTISVGQGSVVKADVMRTTGLTLNQQWNIVGNPFGFAVPLSSLTLSSGDSIRTRAYYSGTGTASGWEVQNVLADTLRPWQGLALYMMQGGAVKFNVAPAAPGTEEPVVGALSARFAEKEMSVDENNWIMNVGASRTDNDMKALDNLVGMLSGSKSGYDAYDWMAPPMVGQKNVSVYFKNSDGGMMRDIRPVNNEGEAWDMKVITGDKGAKIKLDLSGAKSIPYPSFEAYLVDLDESMAYDLRTRSSVEINSKEGIRNFIVLVGTKEFVNNKRRGVDLVPREMKLFANYPNPFNPETVIRYQVSGGREAYSVSLKVYNILGQEVATLVEQEQTPGYYEIKFSARSLTTGVYFYRITVDGGTQDSRYVDVKKMMLMK